MSTAIATSTPTPTIITVDEAQGHLQATTADLLDISQEVLTDTSIERMKRLIMQLQHDLSHIVAARSSEAVQS